MDSQVVEAIVDAVREAGSVVRQQWHEVKEIQFKGPIDLVTQTDVAVEGLLRRRLGEILPQALFYGEESAQGPVPEESVWIVDPVDGTTNYAHGLQHVAVSVALWQKGQPVVGVVYLPVLEELFWAVAGGGAYLGRQPIAVSTQASLEQSLIATGFPYSAPQQAEELARLLGRFLVCTQGVRRLGSAATDLAYVACGRFEAFYETGLKPWDVAAGILLVTEAGGQVSDQSGDPYTFGAPFLVASNGRVHRNVVMTMGYL